MKIFRFSAKVLAGLTTGILAYFLLAFFLSVIPVNKGADDTEDVEIYILTCAHRYCPAGPEQVDGLE